MSPSADYGMFGCRRNNIRRGYTIAVLVFRAARKGPSLGPRLEASTRERSQARQSHALRLLVSSAQQAALVAWDAWRGLPEAALYGLISGRRERNRGSSYTIEVSVQLCKWSTYAMSASDQKNCSKPRNPVKTNRIQRVVIITIQFCSSACGGAALYFQSYHRGHRIAFSCRQVAFRAT